MFQGRDCVHCKIHHRGVNPAAVSADSLYIEHHATYSNVDFFGTAKYVVLAKIVTFTTSITFSTLGQGKSQYKPLKASNQPVVLWLIISPFLHI